MMDELLSRLPPGWKFYFYKMKNIITFELTDPVTGITGTWKRDEDFCINYKGDLTTLIIEECQKLIYGPE